jgi:hypothetical protein
LGAVPHTTVTIGDDLRVVRVVLAIVLMTLPWVVACAGRSSSGAGGESGESGDTGEMLSELCEAALDPVTYANGPVFTPTPVLATPECPAYAGKLMIDLPAPVLVTGTLAVDGTPTHGYIRLRGRDGEGTAIGDTEADGSFAFELWPGRYDVDAKPSDRDLSPYIELLQDVDLTSPVELPLEAPPAVDISGIMTMDGEPAPDPYGYLLVTSADPDAQGAVDLYISDGGFDLRVTPGIYEFFYYWCDYTEFGTLEGGPPPCHDPDAPPIPEGTPRIAPQQRAYVPFASFDIVADTELDVDVPTARVSGIVELDGIAPEGDVRLFLEPEGGYLEGFWMESDGSFDLRVVRGLYRSALGGEARGSVPEIGLIAADLDVEILRESVLLTAIAPSPLPTASDLLALHMTELDVEQDTYLNWTAGEPVLEQRIWPQLASLAFEAEYCWPDDSDHNPRRIATVLDSAHMFEGPTALELEVPFAAVHIDFRELGAVLIERYNTVELVLTAEGEPPRGSEVTFHHHADESSIDVHGYLVPGRYRITFAESLLGTADIVDGTTLQLHVPTSTIEFEVSIGGMVLDPSHSALELFNLETQRHESIHADWDTDRRTFAPGRYELRFASWGEGVPDNDDVVVGCVTIEG